MREGSQLASKYCGAKVVTCRGDQAVLIAVYVVKPKNTRASGDHSKGSNNRYDQSHQAPIHQSKGGYNHYDQNRRSKGGYSQRPALFHPSGKQRALGAPATPTTYTNNKTQVTNNKAPPSRSHKAVRSFSSSSNVKKERKKNKQSRSIANKMNGIATSFRVKKHPTFLQKLLATFQKRR